MTARAEKKQNYGVSKEVIIFEAQRERKKLRKVWVKLWFLFNPAVAVANEVWNWLFYSQIIRQVGPGLAYEEVGQHRDIEIKLLGRHLNG